MGEKRIDTVVWDVDNTLWDWQTMHLAGMRAMADKIAEVTGFSRDEVVRSMYDAYSRSKALDYKPLVQEISVSAKWAESMESKMEAFRRGIDLGFAVHTAYAHARNENFKLYEGVKEVLCELVRNNVRNVIVSDAPLSKVLRRLKYFDIDRYFNMVCARGEPKTQHEMECGSHLLHYEETRRSRGFYNVGIPKENIIVLEDEKKPNVNLARLLSRTADEISDNVAVVGDNPEKDMKMAHLNNCLGILAAQGAPDVQTRAGLSEFGPADVVARNSAEINPENAEIIKIMGDRFKIAKESRDILKYVIKAA
jgi:phosphoglycolate phosphatase-like HAD superfamily hydrolase